MGFKSRGDFLHYFCDRGLVRPEGLLSEQWEVNPLLAIGKHGLFPRPFATSLAS